MPSPPFFHCVRFSSGYNAEAMSLAQAIRSRIDHDTRGIRPHYERYSLLAIPATIRQLFGIEHPGSVAEECALLPSQRVVCMVVDGLGYLKLSELLESGQLAFGRRTGDATLVPLTSVFPPTTTTALTSLSTGLSPSGHGVLGYTMFLQDPGAVINMIHLAAPGAASGTLAKLGLTPEQLLPGPTLYQQLADIDVPTTLFLPKFIVGSQLSEVLYRGVDRTVPFLSLSDLFMHLRSSLQRPGRRFLSVYWPTTDSLAHTYGPESTAFASEVRSFFRLLEEEFLAQAHDVTVLITADHGFQSFDPASDVVSCTDHPELRRGLLFPPVGEARAASLFLRRGHEQEVAGFLRNQFSDAFEVLTTEQALERGLWGDTPPHPEVAARLGDLLVLARGSKSLMWPKEPVKMRGMHGGITPQELLVPLMALSV